MERIDCFGYGRTTRAIAKRFGPCRFYDDNVLKPFRDEDGNRVLPSRDFDPRYSRLQIPSPGIKPTHPLIERAGRLVGEYDFFADAMPFGIWVSGTNGKTTTTQMITHLLADKGALSGGNIGTPLAELDPDAPIWVLETSSFSLHYTHVARPNLYVLLDISPDHLSWHGSMEAYEAAKLSPLARMKEGEFVLLPQRYASTPTAAQCVGYDGVETLADFFGIDLSRLRYKGVFLLDAVLALCVERILYDRCSYERINAFTLDPHRQEEFTDAAGRLWVNDSKATNLDATLAALQTYGDRALHLILGGDDKGVDLRPLFKALSPLQCTVYAIGSNAERLETLADTFGVACRRCDTLEQAVQTIAAVHDEHAVALLSPAAASLDQFASYQQRGERFKALAEELS